MWFIYSKIGSLLFGGRAFDSYEAARDFVVENFDNASLSSVLIDYSE